MGYLVEYVVGFVSSIVNYTRVKRNKSVHKLCLHSLLQVVGTSLRQAFNNL